MESQRLRFKLALAAFAAWVLVLTALAVTSGVRPVVRPVAGAGAGAGG